MDLSALLIDAAKEADGRDVEKDGESCVANVKSHRHPKPTRPEAVTIPEINT